MIAITHSHVIIKPHDFIHYFIKIFCSFLILSCTELLDHVIVLANLTVSKIAGFEPTFVHCTVAYLDFKS